MPHASDSTNNGPEEEDIPATPLQPGVAYSRKPTVETPLLVSQINESAPPLETFFCSVIIYSAYSQD